jgi:hypothetical protein
MPNTITLSPPACRRGRLCTSVFNDRDTAVSVTVTFTLSPGGSAYSCTVSVPAHGAEQCCVSPTDSGLFQVTVSAPGATSASAQIVLPCS